MKVTKRQLRKVIQEALSLQEVYYDSRKPVENYKDADELIGQRLWAHTNRTHRNQGRNGMVGLYGTTGKGTRTGSPLFYTNALRLSSPVVFQVSSGKSLADIEKTGKRTLVAGVSGTVIETNEDTGVEGFQEVVFDPFAEEKYFFVAESPDEPIATADEVYFKASEEGEWTFLVKNPRGYDDV
tara:strand:- start:168 stop:716 length:549 start_codon:yes stop_codon:yes gene_type:complete